MTRPGKLEIQLPPFGAEVAPNSFVNRLIAELNRGAMPFPTTRPVFPYSLGRPQAGYCKNCKAPIKDEADGFCEQPNDVCWHTWCLKQNEKELARQKETTMSETAVVEDKLFIEQVEAALIAKLRAENTMLRDLLRETVDALIALHMRDELFGTRDGDCEIIEVRDRACTEVDEGKHAPGRSQQG